MSITTGIQRRGEPAAGIWVATAGCWGVLLTLALTGTGHPGHHDVAGATLGPIGVAGFLAGWLTMVGAMMLPCMAPVARRLTDRSPAGGRVPVLVAAFAGVWAAFGLLALAGDVIVHRLVDRSAWLDGRPALVLAGVLLLAGVVRFAALSAVALHRGLARPRIATAADRTGAWRAGLGLGARSLVRDGPLMLVMFAAGSADLSLMVMLTAVMVAERDERWGHRVGVLTGCVLIAAAAVVAVTG